MAKSKDWAAYLKPFYGKNCTMRDVGYCGGEFVPKIIDQKKEKTLVEAFILQVIGSWEYLAEQLGTGGCVALPSKSYRPCLWHGQLGTGGCAALPSKSHRPCLWHGQFEKEPGTLVMFATNSGEGDDAAALFYDRGSGDVYKYEESSFDDTSYRLDQLRLKISAKKKK